jgi:hypothetical protein
VLAHELLVGGALEERVGLDLVDGGGDVSTEAAKARLAFSSPGFWIHSLVVTNSSSRGMPLPAMARPTASSFW